MAETTSTPALTFHDARVPPLESGRYSLQIHQTTSGPNGVEEGTQPPSTSTFTFEVNGPRFRIPQQDIVACYPPASSDGDYTGSYAHVELARATLPWERSAVTEADPPVPWLALLVFGAPRVQVADASTPSGTQPSSDIDAVVRPQPTTGKELDQPAMLIQVRRSLLPADSRVLRSRCHVRGGGSVPDEHAFVVSERPLAAGRWSAHLVSVEEQYTSGDGLAATEDFVELVSLTTWSFTTEGESFEHRMNGLDRGEIRLPGAGPSPQVDGTEPLDHGHVPLAHLLRDGSQTYSWYRGPLLPWAPDDVGRAESVLPARHSDHLLRIDPRNGLIDVSYAAAWELGRMLTLRNERVAVALHQWKLSHHRASHAEGERQADRDGNHAATFHPMVGRHPDWTETEPAFPGSVANWLGSLGRLENLPFNYLVPDERMLPVDSLRFFHLDSDWIACLLDGAFSIGRTLAVESWADDRHRDVRLAEHLNPPASAGFLLRSSIVSEWPGLIVEASRADGTPCDVVRLDRLSPDLLLGLFAVPDAPPESVAWVDFSLHPGTLHLAEPSTNRADESSSSGAAFAANRESTGPKIRVIGGLTANSAVA
jgi:hypothetical protein